MLLPEGAALRQLNMNVDDRGVFTEINRDSWDTEFNLIQWNAVFSKATVLRGVHVHKKHWDCLCLLQGKALFALRDLRSNSPTQGMVSYVEMKGNDLRCLIVPPGVAHGFYFYEQSIHIYGVSEYWNVDDELGCHYADPDLAVDWPNRTPKMSDRDANLPPLRSIINHF